MQQIIDRCRSIASVAKPWSIIVSNINKHLAFESILADCQHGYEGRGLAKPNWFNYSMIWLAIWIVH